MILTICFICITFAIALILSAASDQQWESMANNDLELDKLHRGK